MPLLAIQVNDLEKQVKLSLAGIAEDRRISRLELYKFYHESKEFIDQQSALVIAASNYEGILDGIASSHKALRDGVVTAEQRKALSNFVALTDDLSELVSAVSKQ